MRIPSLLVLSLFLAGSAEAAESTARLVTELVGVEQTLRDTRWTFDTRDQKKTLEEQAALLREILGTVSSYEAVLQGCGPVLTPVPQPYGKPGLAVRVPRTISDAEVNLIDRILRIDDQLERGDWGFSNRDEEKALREERKRAKETLARITLALCGDDRVVTVLRR